MLTVEQIKPEMFAFFLKKYLRLKMTPSNLKSLAHRQTAELGLILYVLQKYLSRHIVTLKKYTFYPVHTLRFYFFMFFCDLPYV
jgi:hypothetical protein